MRGHIRKRGGSSWAIVLDLGRDAAGKRRQKWHSIKGTRRDAQRELARLLNELNIGAYVEPARMTVSEFFDRWLADYAKPKVSAKTFERYREMIDGHIRPALGTYMLPKLAPLHIQSFYSHALARGRKDGKGGLSAQSVVHFHRVLHKALAQAVKWQLLARNPVDAVEPPRAERKEMRALDEEETAKLLGLLDGNRLYAPVFLAVTTGLRRGEILGLRWSDMDLEAGTLTVVQSLEQTKDGLKFKAPKTHRSRRSIALPAMTVEVLRAHRAAQAEERLALGPAYEENGLVCPRPGGGSWAPDAFSTAFAAFVRRSGMKPFRFHDLRHSHATHLLRAGVHPKVVSERLGHSSVGITLDTYSHVLPGMQQEAVKLVDFALATAIAQHGKVGPS
ncbi:tyrosine-type recombinase/integrase [Methyloceanibacter caenitepidi]|uniref:Integrase n=1 Tax=Methyloceanibacter caenitepidi TaxID=1384459 RepID=A0A0A8JYV4_9HYPH|nr:site-specific integrase [Methyloceanibacter caenitepidi]BAQ15606.1 integrase [Methyloceanibacter caenitepidi]